MNILRNYLGVEQVVLLVGVLEKHSTLVSLCGNEGHETVLDMSEKMDSAEDAALLVPEIVANEALTSLNLSSTSLQNEGAKHIAKAITGHVSARDVFRLVPIVSPN